MTMPTLSVIMPNYNHGKYIREAIEAILSQSYRPTELIIIDDASTDNSIEVIAEFVKKDKIVRLIANEKNMGVIHNDNRFGSFAQGDYIYFTSADDKVLPGFFEKSIELLSRYPQAGLCCSDSSDLDVDRNRIVKKNINIVDSPCYFTPQAVSELLRKTPFYIATHSSIIKRSALLEAGGFIPALKWHSDWLLLFVTAFRHGICYVPEPLSILRVYPHSYSKSGIKKWPAQYEILDNLLSLLRALKYRDTFPLFRKSCALDNLILPGIFRVILSNPKHWVFLSLPLIWKNLKYKALKILSPVIPLPLKNIYRGIRDRRINGRVYKILEGKRYFG